MAIGISVQRSDALGKVTGRARFTGDFDMPGMLHAVYVRSPLAHALVRHIDTKAAEALPGVEAVFTAEHVPDTLYPTAGHPHALDPAKADVADRNLLTRHVRYVGDEVAIVVARDELTARQAAQLVQVDYEPLPVMVSPEQALAPGAVLLHPRPVQSPDPSAQPQSAQTNMLEAHTMYTGVPDAAAFANIVAAAEVRVSAKFHTPMVQHCHMESQVAYAYMDDSPRIVIVSSTQIPHICRRIVGLALGMDWSLIRVIKPFIGGGFGNKQDVIVEPMVAFLTQKLGGRPVKLELSREECLISTRVRHPFDMAVTLGASTEGVLTAISLEATVHSGAYASHGHTIARSGGGKMATMYPKAAYGYKAQTVYCNSPTGGAMRGYGSPQICFALESAMDDLALTLGLDPLNFRLRNVGRSGDLSPVNSLPMHTHGLHECLLTGAERFQWKERQAAALHSGPLLRGVGVACFSYGTGTYPANMEGGGARLILNQDGTFFLSCGATEIGQGADTALAQMAAHTLGVPDHLVRTLSTQDTDFSPYDPAAFASRQTFVAGHAVKRCAEEMRLKILRYAAEMTGHSVDYLSLVGPNLVFTQQPGIGVLSLRDLALDAYYHKERGGQLNTEVSLKVRSNPPSFGCTFAEVEIDVALCRLRVTELLNVHDSGTIINPLLAEGQVRGGASMGIGWALSEELLIDPVSGAVHNGNLLDYKLPTMLDTPPIGCAFVQSAEPTSAYGNKALGEPPILSPAPAIRNAVLHATGVHINRLPLSPQTLFRHFQAAGLL